MHMVIEFIEQHLCEPLSLSCIASFTGYSGCYIDRLFTQVMGQSLCRYIRRRQISSAAYLLVHTQKPVIDIAFLSGYKSQQSFTAAFALQIAAVHDAFFHVLVLAEYLVLFQKLHAEGRTIIFVTHNPELSQYSSRNIR